jgi:hypothetical protein
MEKCYKVMAWRWQGEIQRECDGWGMIMTQVSEAYYLGWNGETSGLNATGPESAPHSINNMW